MRRPNIRFHHLRERGRRVAESARRRIAPARGRVVDWTRTAMASEVAPMPLGRPGIATKIALGIFALLVAAIVVFLMLFDWNHLRGPIGRYASERWDRDIRIEGDLDVDLFRWAPQAVVHGLKVGPPEWAGGAETADVKRLTLSVKLMPLLKGDVDMPVIQADQPRLTLIRDAEGRESWRFGNPNSKKATELPLIRRFIVDDGRINFTDEKRRLKLVGTINSRESIARGEESAFRLDGRGTLNGNPLSVTIKGGPLINIRKDQPYRFTGDLRGGSTRIQADGAITRPFDLGRFDANLTVSGPDAADLYYLTTLTLPNTPPYRIRGRLSRAETLWRFDDFSGRVGDSDLSGDLEVQAGREPRPLLKATLVSRSLDMDDLFAIVGGAPDPGETASAGQKQMASSLRAQGRMLPDAPLDVKRLRSMDAEVSYRAASVKANRIALRQVRIGADLKNAVLNLDPFAFNFSRGQLNGTIRLDARKTTPFTSADLRLRNYPLEAIIPARGGAPTLTGAMTARAKLSGPGKSVHEAASNASGQVSVIVPDGTMRQAFAELMGINVGRGLYLLLNKDPRQTPLNCAVASFGVSGGVMRANTLVIDTGVVVARGKGSVNLRTERMSFEIDGESKKPRLLRVWAPITVNGPIRSPKLGVKTSEVVAQGGLAAVLGAAISPLAAILPFLEPGGAKGANCAALEAGGKG